MLAGTGVAAYVDDAVWWKALLALVVALALQVGVNYANDYSDGIRGTDADRVGPLRLVGSGAAVARRGEDARRSRRSASPRSPGWCSPRPPRGGWSRSARSASLAAWFYTGGSQPYGYLGLGEVMVFVFFGLVAVLGTTYVQTETLHARPRCTPRSAIGALACAILVANNLRDIPTDRDAGKRTLAVRARRRAHPRPLRAAGLARRWSRWSASRSPPPGGRCSGWCSLRPGGPRGAAVVLGGATGRGLVPVLQLTGVAELLCTAVALAFAG